MSSASDIHEIQGIEFAGDPLHMPAIAELTPGERLERAFGWIELYNELYGIALGDEERWPTHSESASRSSRVS